MYEYGHISYMIVHVYEYLYYIYIFMHIHARKIFYRGITFSSNDNGNTLFFETSNE